MTLTDFLKQNPRVVLALSGGTDSSYLLYKAVRKGASVRACYLHTDFRPDFEKSHARRLAAQL